MYLYTELDLIERGVDFVRVYLKAISFSVDDKSPRVTLTRPDMVGF